MEFSKKDIKFEFMRGKGPGGAHRNKTDSTVRATHLPTGISVVIDGRHQHKNKKKAVKILQQRVRELQEEERAQRKKARRDKVIHERNIVRTYDFSRSEVRDHRTGKRASIKNILVKGKLGIFYNDK